MPADSRTAPFAAAASPGLWATGRELIALLRLALFLRVTASDIAGRESTIAVLAVLSLVLWASVDPMIHSRDLVFTWYAVPDLIAMAAGVITVAWLIKRFSTPRLPWRRTLVLTLAVLPLAMLAEMASWKLANQWLVPLTAAVCSYSLVFMARGLRLFTGSAQPRALIVGVISAAAFLLSLDYLQANPRLWVRAEERLDRLNVAGIDWARMARVQFAQQARIDAGMAAMAPQTPGATDTFFLGFAGYGEEKIFASDIDLASRVVAERFGAGERSLRLINDRRDVETHPIATEPGLRHALGKIGAAMGEEDVLFLALSSHGERGQGVRVSNPGMAPSILGAAQLREMLDEAGIGWRVIVVSACYSGGFVDALSDERSVVIAAASADRKSFGCNDSRALTYFGEEFYQRSLAGSTTLRSAFEQARVALEKKERAAGIVPSLPRASFGALVEAKLAGLNENLAAQGR